MSFASFKPRPVISRTTLIALSLFAPPSVSSTSNSVCSSAAAAGAPAAGAPAIIIGAAAVTPNFSSSAFLSSDASTSVRAPIFSTNSSTIADIDVLQKNNIQMLIVNYAALLLATSSTSEATSRMTALIEPTMPEIGASRLPMIAAIISSRVGKEAISFNCLPSKN